MKTILINANAHAIWVEADTLEAAQRAIDAIAGYTQEWTTISRREFDDCHGDRYTVVEVEAGDWSADDADRALSEGTVIGYCRADEILETAA